MQTTSNAINILFIGYESGSTDTAPNLPEEENDQPLVGSATKATDVIDTLNREDVDCIVSEYELPSRTGLDLLESVRDEYPELPFILYTDAGNEAVASEAISADVTDYIRAESGEDTKLTDSILGAVTGDQTQIDHSQERRRYQAILSDPNLLVGILDTEGTLLEANQTAGEYISPDVAEMVGRPFWETAWWDEETRPLVRQKVERAASGNYAEYKTDLTDATGDSYSVTGTIRPVEDETGEIVSLIVSALDVTEQKVQRQRAERDKRLVQRILDTLPDVFYQFDADGYLLRWNEQLEAATGYSTEEIREMYVTEFVPDDEIEQISKQFQTVISERRSVTVESAFETETGERIPYEFTGGPVETSGGDIRGLIGIGRDLSDWRQQQRQFEAIFNNTYQFTGLMSPDGTLLEVNQTALSFGDLDQDDIVGTKLWDAYWFQVGEEARETAAKAVEQASNGEFFREELEVQGEEQNAIIDFSVRPVTDEDGEVTRLIPEGRDITRLKERERQLQVTNRVLRHNIRNQLNLIRGTAVSLVKNGEKTADPDPELIVDASDSLSKTAEKTRQLNELVEDSPDPKSVDLAECIDTAVATLSEQYPRAEIETKLPETASVEAIPNIQTAIKELLENAIVHNESDHPEVTVSVTSGDSTEIAVTDNAGGISDMEQRILTGDASIDPLAHGEGLGMWYVYRAVRYSGGSIAVAERADGSEVQISLPQDSV